MSDVFTLAEESFYLFRLVETGHQLRLEVVFDEVDHEVHDGLVVEESLYLRFFIGGPTLGTLSWIIFLTK